MVHAFKKANHAMNIHMAQDYWLNNTWDRLWHHVICLRPVRKTDMGLELTRADVSKRDYYRQT